MGVHRLNEPALWEVEHARRLAVQLSSRCCAVIEPSEVIEALAELNVGLRSHPGLVARALAAVTARRDMSGHQLSRMSLVAQAERERILPGELIEVAQLAGWEVI